MGELNWEVILKGMELFTMGGYFVGWKERRGIGVEVDVSWLDTIHSPLAERAPLLCTS